MKVLKDSLKKQGQKIRVEEAIHGKDDMETFLKMARDIGIKTLGELETFLKNEKEPGDRDEWETMLRYRASLGNDFKIKEELTEAIIPNFSYDTLFYALDKIGIIDDFDDSRKFLSNAVEYIEEADKKAKEIKLAFKENFNIRLNGPKMEIFDGAPFITLETEINDIEYHIYLEDPSIYCWYEDMESSDQEQFNSLKELIDYFQDIVNDNLDESLTEDKETCVLCGKHIDGYGNNPAPLADEGKCCDSCNSKRVIPARLKAMKVNKMNEDNKSLTDLQECDQFEYDDDYTIDYEDEDEEAIEYDDDYSFRK